MDRRTGASYLSYLLTIDWRDSCGVWETEVEWRTHINGVMFFFSFFAWCSLWRCGGRAGKVLGCFFSLLTSFMVGKGRRELPGYVLSGVVFYWWLVAHGWTGGWMEGEEGKW